MARIEETRVVMMSSDLMKLYELHAFEKDAGHQPITFRHPDECLELMIDREAEPDFFIDDEVELDKAEKLEKQWGELELRLSFFLIDSYKWQ